MDAPEPKGEANDRSAAVIARPDEPPSSEPVEVTAADALAWLATRSGEGRIDEPSGAPTGGAPSASEAPSPGAAASATRAAAVVHDARPAGSLPPTAGSADPEPEEISAADAVAWLATHSGEGRIDESEPEEVSAADAVAWLATRSGEGTIEEPRGGAASGDGSGHRGEARATDATAEGAALFCRIAERAGVLPREQAQSLLDAWRQQPGQDTDALARATLALGLLTPAQVDSVLRLAGLTPTVPIDAGPSFLPDGPEFALLVRLKRLASDGDLAGCAALQTQLAGTVFARLGDVIVRKSALARGAPPPTPSPQSTARPPAPSQPPRPSRPTPTPVRAARRQAFDLYVRLKQAVARRDTAEAGALREQLRGDPEFDRLAEGLVRKVWGRQALVSARATGAALVPCPGCRTPAPADAPCPRCGAATPQPPAAGGP